MADKNAAERRQRRSCRAKDSGEVPVRFENGRPVLTVDFGPTENAIVHLTVASGLPQRYSTFRYYIIIIERCLTRSDYFKFESDF